VKKVLALLFSVALSISLSSFAFAQNDKPADQPADKTGQPADKRDGTSTSAHHHHHHKHHKRTQKDETKDETKKDDTKKDDTK
jgi:hypothetical protein